MYDSLYGLATRSTPPVNPTTVKTRTSIYQPQPTSATCNDRPAAFNNSTDLNFPQRSFSCIQRFDWSQLPATIIQLHSTTRPTSASRNDRPAAFYDSTNTSYPHQISSCAHLRLDHTSYQHHPSSWRPKYNRHGLYTHVCKSGNKLSLLLYLLPRLCSLHWLWLSLLARIKLKTFAGSTCLSAP